MNHLRLMRDERELTVDHAADRLSYLVLSFGLLVVVAWRSLALGEASWDLLALVLLGGLAGTAYRIRERAASRRWWTLAVLTGALALGLAVVVAMAARA